MGVASKDQIAEFAGKVHREAVRRLQLGSRRLGDIDDIAQEVAMKFARQAERHMARYATPAAFVAATLRSTTIDWERRNRAQRGEGARPVSDHGGGVRRRREVASLDAPSKGRRRTRPGSGVTTRQDTPCDDGWEDAVVTRIDTELVLDQLDDADRGVVADLYAGWSVVETARRRGRSRDQVNRLRKRLGPHFDHLRGWAS